MFLYPVIKRIKKKVQNDSPVLIKCTDLSHNDVAVEHAQQNPNLTQQHVALTVGDLGNGDLQHQLHQVTLPYV